MQAGISYCAVEEDAELLHKKFGHKYRIFMEIIHITKQDVVQVI